MPLYATQFASVVLILIAPVCFLMLYQTYVNHYAVWVEYIPYSQVMCYHIELLIDIQKVFFLANSKHGCGKSYLSCFWLNYLSVVDDRKRTGRYIIICGSISSYYRT
jgi:hypothetical protein